MPYVSIKVRREVYERLVKLKGKLGATLSDVISALIDYYERSGVKPEPRPQLQVEQIMRMVGERLKPLRDEITRLSQRLAELEKKISALSTACATTKQTPTQHEKPRAVTQKPRATEKRAPEVPKEARQLADQDIIKIIEKCKVPDIVVSDENVIVVLDESKHTLRLIERNGFSITSHPVEEFLIRRITHKGKTALVLKKKKGLEVIVRDKSTLRDVRTARVQ